MEMAVKSVDFQTSISASIRIDTLNNTYQSYLTSYLNSEYSYFSRLFTILQNLHKKYEEKSIYIPI
jgi:hypothetical protein